jgi:hypothetical protein
MSFWIGTRIEDVFDFDRRPINYYAGGGAFEPARLTAHDLKRFQTEIPDDHLIPLGRHALRPNRKYDLSLAGHEFGKSFGKAMGRNQCKSYLRNCFDNCRAFKDRWLDIVENTSTGSFLADPRDATIDEAHDQQVSLQNFAAGFMHPLLSALLSLCVADLATRLLFSARYPSKATAVYSLTENDRWL